MPAVLEPTQNHSTAQPSRKALLGVILYSRTVANLPIRLTYPFLPALSRGLGVSLAAGSALLSVRSLLGVLAPLFGLLSDRWGERRVMLLGLLLLTLGAGLTAGIPWYWIALAGSGIIGLAKSSYDPAMQAYIGERVPYRERGRTLGIIELSWSATWLGMPVAGWLIEHVSWRAPFAAIAVLGLTGWWLTRRILAPDLPQPPANPPAPSGNRRLGDNFQSLLRDRHTWLALAISGGLMLAQDTLMVVYGAWMEDGFGLTVTTLGLLSLLLGGVEAVAEMGVALLSDKLGKRRSALIGLASTTLAYLLLPRLPQQLPFAVAGIAFLVLSFEFTIVVLIPLVSGMSATARGTLMALNTATIAVGRIIAPLLAVALYRPGDLSRNGLVAALITLTLIGLLLQLRERGH